MLTFYRKHTVENRIKHIFSLNQENDENCLLRNSTGEMNEYFHRKKIFNGIKCDKGDHKVNRQKYLQKIFFNTMIKINNCKIQNLSSLLKTKFILLVYLLITCVSLLEYKFHENRTCLLFTILI